jgi:hypothetical protein
MCDVTHIHHCCRTGYKGKEEEVISRGQLYERY